MYEGEPLEDDAFIYEFIYESPPPARSYTSCVLPLHHNNEEICVVGAPPGPGLRILRG